MAKFKNKYHIESTRKPNWDYGSNAAYFVTICTKNSELCFGNIENDKMNFTEIGKIAQQYYFEIPDHFPFVKLGEYVVMPNHVHGIIIVDKTIGKSIENIIDGATIVRVETQNIASLSQKPLPTDQPRKTKNKFGPQSQNLGSILRGYKTGVSVYAKIHNIDFAWQFRFHDRIIRDKAEYQRIEKYIRDNPKNWNIDKFKK